MVEQYAKSSDVLDKKENKTKCSAEKTDLMHPIGRWLLNEKLALSRRATHYIYTDKIVAYVRVLEEQSSENVFKV